MTKEQLMQKATGILLDKLNEYGNFNSLDDLDEIQLIPEAKDIFINAMLEMWNAALDEAINNSQWVGDYFIGISEEDLTKLKIDL